MYTRVVSACLLDYVGFCINKYDFCINISTAQTGVNLSKISWSQDVYSQRLLMTPCTLLRNRPAYKTCCIRDTDYNYLFDLS